MNRFVFLLFVLISLISPAIAQDPATGLDSPLVWTASGSPAWKTVTSSSSVSGGDVARVAQAGESALETVVSGPAVASFSWRLLEPDGKGWLSLEIDGHEMATLRRAVPWKQVEINLPSGSHTIQIRARGMARVPGSAAEVDDFVMNTDMSLSWLQNIGDDPEALWVRIRTVTIKNAANQNIGDDPEALWVVSGSGRVTAEEMPNLSFNDGHVATVRGTDRAGRTSLIRLVQGPARLKPRVNVKGGIFSARDLDSVGTIRQVNASEGSTWNDEPLIIGPGLHRVEWVHHYWAQMEDENDPYPETPPANLIATPMDVATLVSLSITPLTLNDTLPGGLVWTSSGTNPFVPTLGDWTGSLNREHQAVLAVERPGPGQDARLSTEIIGPAEVTLRAVGDGPEGDVLRILANGEIKFEDGREGSTGSQTFEIPAGPVAVEIEWISDFGPDGWPRKAELNGVEIRRPLPAEANAALDAPDAMAFFTTHPELWETHAADPRSDLAARTRQMPLSSVDFPELSAWVDGPSVLTYWRRAEVPAGTSLPFPGILNYYDPGPFSWQAVTVAIPAGRHRLVWYPPISGEGFFSATDHYDLDGFNLVPGTGESAIPLAEALDTVGRTWRSSGNDVTAGNFAQQSMDGIDAVSLVPADQSSAAWVETSVSGPATITVHSWGSTLGLTVNGVYPEFGATSTDLPEHFWQRTVLAVPSGEHLVRFASSDPRHPLFLDMVEITPLPELSINDALDAPELTLSSGGDRWQPLSTAETPDGDALFAGQGNGWIASEISAPARVRFEWKVDSEYTRLALELDGAEIAVARSWVGWEAVTLDIPTGTHVLRWTYTRPDYASGASGLNGLSVEPLASATLGDSVDAPDRIWLNTGPQPQWTAQSEVSHDGSDAAYFPTSEDESTNGGSNLVSSVTGPALVHFWWRKDGPGMAYFQMDGRNIASLNEENAWQESTIAVPPGSHILRWIRFKNHYFERRAAMWVDDFRVEPGPAGLTLGDALEAPDLPWRTSADAPWEIAWRSLPDGSQEPAVISSAAPGVSTWIETDVTGPATLSFHFLEDSFGLSQGSLMIDGIAVLPLRGASWPDDAIPGRWTVPAGSHTVRWQWDVVYSEPVIGSSSLERLMIDRVEIDTDRPPLDSLFPEDLEVTLTGTHPWTVQPDVGGGFRAESHPVAADSQSELEMVVPGNRELAFRTGWAGLRPNRIGGNFFSVDGPWYAIHGQGGYVADEMHSVWHLPAGADHTLRWTTSSAIGVIDAMYLDQVSLDTPDFPIGESLGIPEKTFLSAGGGRWHGQNTSTHGDGPAVSSTGSGSLITQFTGPGTVSWWWKTEGSPVDSSALLIVWPYGQSSVYATGNGSFDWKREEVILPWDQTFRLEWRAEGTGDGRLVVDDVIFHESATDTYTAWAIQNFIGGNSATMAADPDGDGIPNLMEFAFGSDPNSRRSAYLQDLRFANGQIHLCLTHPEHDTTGVNFDLEFSNDLQDWIRIYRILDGPSLPDLPVTCAMPAVAEGDYGFVRIRLSLSND